MVNSMFDYFGGLSEDEYTKETEEHFRYIDHICKCNCEQASLLLDKFKEKLFTTELVASNEATMLYHTILLWKDKAEMYDSVND